LGGGLAACCGKGFLALVAFSLAEKEAHRPSPLGKQGALFSAYLAVSNRSVDFRNFDQLNFAQGETKNTDLAFFPENTGRLIVFAACATNARPLGLAA